MADETPFAIRFDAADRILTMRLAGFWSVATLADYTARLLQEVGQLRARRIRYDVLSDARAFGVQSKDVTAGFNALAKQGAEHHDGRTAIVVGSQLNKIQAERVMAAPSTRIFLDHDEARAWLLAGRTP